MKHLNPPSQLVLRHAELFAGSSLLLVNAPDAEVLSAVPVSACWHLHAGFASAAQLQAPHLIHHFSAEPPTQHQAQAALVWLPKEKQLTWYLLEALRSVLPKQAVIWLVGENRGGIKSIHKQFPAAFSSPQKVTVGNHSLLIRATIEETLAVF